MSQGADTDDPSTGQPALDRLIRGNQAWLVERGRTIVGSGCFCAGRLAGSLHTDFGPDDQDKETNQDYALAWLPHDAKTQERFRLILALGDGLTTSFRSEWASALACLVAVRALVEGDPGMAPTDLARAAFHQAGQALGELADELGCDPEASCPPGLFVSTWKYMLRKGALFQTTLTLAWFDEHFFRVAMIGDGGALWREPSPGQRPADRILAQCDFDRHQVRALGPADRSVQQFDCWHERQLTGPFLGALHTDGVGRGLGGHPETLLDELEKLQAAGAENPARRFIERAIDERPQDFDDNLSLAVIRAE